MEMLSSLVPTLTVKYLSCLAMTSFGPSYGVWRGDFLKSPAYEYELCIGQVLRHVRPGTTVVTGGDGTEVTDPFT